MASAKQTFVKEKSVRTFVLVTLGCKVNQYETQVLRESWCAQGYREVEESEQAQLAVINSCAITANAVADVRAAVRRLQRQAPECQIIITGCAAQVLHKELAALTGVAAVVLQEAKPSLLRGIETLLPATNALTPVTIREESTKGSFPAGQISHYTRTRAIVKIQDGCSHGCTYCIVPQTRGRSTSRPYTAILAEIQRLLKNGFREIVLCGINLRLYGQDLQPTTDFWKLVAALEKELSPHWAGELRFRISSLEPGQLHERALDVLAQSRLIAPHLHLSLQSGSPTVLERMNRGHYNLASLQEYLHKLHSIWPVYGLGADIISGFPGETDAEHEQTLHFCANLPLSYAHVFPYSARPHTRAAALLEQISPVHKKERAAQLRSIIGRKKQAFQEKLLTQSRHYIVQEGKSLQGVNEYYVTTYLSEKETDKQQLQQYAPHALIPVQPLRIQDNKLIVALEHVNIEKA